VDRGLAITTARLRRGSRGRRTTPTAPALLAAARRASLRLADGTLTIAVITVSVATAVILVTAVTAVIVAIDRSVGVAVRLRPGRVLRIRA
jgi:hypothetical protein